MKFIVRFSGCYPWFFLFVILVAVIASGCGRSPRETARFARAGTTYTTAMDTLLVRTSDLSIDANSEFIVSRDAISNVSIDQYTAIRDADREKLKAINRLRAHTKLLARYFELLYQLSTSDAPEETATAVEGTVKSINELGNQLRGSPLITPAATIAISNITKLIVTAKIRRALNRELEARNETIRKELVTQEELLKFLADDIEQSLKITNAIQEKRKVIDPLIATNPIGDIDGWKVKRRTAVTALATVDDLRNASGAIANLREAYESLLSGKLNIARINDALDDLEMILSTAESLKKAIGEER